MTYRIPMANMKPSQLSGTGTFVRVTSIADGLSLDGVPVGHLPVVRHRDSGLLGWKGMIVTDIQADPDDSNYYLVSTRDVVLPMSFEDNPDNPVWQDARYIPITPESLRVASET